MFARALRSKKCMRKKIPLVAEEHSLCALVVGLGLLSQRFRAREQICSSGGRPLVTGYWVEDRVHGSNCSRPVYNTFTVKGFLLAPNLHIYLRRSSI